MTTASSVPARVKLPWVTPPTIHGPIAPKQRPSAARFLAGPGAPATGGDDSPGACASLYTSVPFRQETSFLVVGERMNATGLRAFRDLLLAGDLDGMIALAKEQTAEGAHVLDVMVDYVGRDGVPDMTTFVSALRTQSTLPLMFDSTDAKVFEPVREAAE